VLSNNDGCAIARTKEAKELGIKMGAPYFKIKNFCEQNNVAVFSTNFSLYTNISERVMQTLIRNSPEVELYSIDEAFLNLTGVADPELFSRELRSKVLRNIGIPTGVGVAPTKVLCKVANHFAKRSDKAGGVVSLMSEKLQTIALSRLPIEDVWGVGRQNSIKMKSLGIKTALDLRDYKNEHLVRRMFSVIGLKIKHELMGINCFEFNEPIKNKKEIMCSRTFSGVINEKKALKEAISNYISNAALKLRQQNSLCHKVTVFFRTNPFNNSEQSYVYGEEKLVNPTCNTLKLIKVAESLIDLKYQEGYEYKKAGAKLSGFTGQDEFQVNFLDDTDTEEEMNLMRCMDKINYLEGDQTLKSLSCGTDDKAWRMNRRFKSPRYTTSWNELYTFD